MALPALPVLVAVGAIWGITNPFIKRASSAQPQKTPQGNGKGAAAYGAALVQLVQRYWALILNLSASALFFFTLQEVEVSLAVPLSNGTTFVFTALVGHLLGEPSHPVLVPLGICLTVFGIFMCITGR